MRRYILRRLLLMLPTLLGVAVLVFLLFTLGWQWALLRLVLGAVLVFGGALLATRMAGGLNAPAPVLACVGRDRSRTSGVASRPGILAQPVAWRSSRFT